MKKNRLDKINEIRVEEGRDIEEGLKKKEKTLLNMVDLLLQKNL